MAARRQAGQAGEGDLIIGKNQASQIGTLVERASGFVQLLHLPNRRSADLVAEEIIKTMKALPETCLLYTSPFPLPAEVGVQPDPRRARMDVAVSVINTVMPHFALMHEMTTDHVHEEIQLLANDVSTMLLETLSDVPRWRDYYHCLLYTSSTAASGVAGKSKEKLPSASMSRSLSRTIATTRSDQAPGDGSL